MASQLSHRSFRTDVVLHVLFLRRGLEPCDLIYLGLFERFLIFCLLFKLLFVFRGFVHYWPKCLLGITLHRRNDRLLEWLWYLLFCIKLNLWIVFRYVRWLVLWVLRRFLLIVADRKVWDKSALLLRFCFLTERGKRRLRCCVCHIHGCLVVYYDFSTLYTLILLLLKLLLRLFLWL